MEEVASEVANAVEVPAQDESAVADIIEAAIADKPVPLTVDVLDDLQMVIKLVSDIKKILEGAHPSVIEIFKRLF